MSISTSLDGRVQSHTRAHLSESRARVASMLGDIVEDRSLGARLW